MRWTTRTTLVSVLLCGCGSGPSVSRPGTEAFQDEIDQWVAGAGHYGVEAAVVFADGGSWAGLQAWPEPGWLCNPAT